MNLYSIRMRHDRGTVTLQLPAADIPSAARRIADIERAPLRAVLSVRCIREDIELPKSQRRRRRHPA